MNNRICPRCNNNIEYSTIESLRRAIKNNGTCLKCRYEIKKEKAKQRQKDLVGYIFKKVCPVCENEMNYKSNSALWLSKKKNTVCKDCKHKESLKRKSCLSIERNCPKCNSIIIYKSYHSRNNAERIKSKCFNCGQKEGGIKRIKINKNIKYEKLCPECNSIIIYKRLSSLSYSIRNDVICKKCRESKSPNIKERNCPKCNKIVYYTSKGACCLAEKNNAKCKKCSANDPDRIARQSVKVSGENNYFYGKKHNEKTISIIKEKRKLQITSKETKEKLRINATGQNNHMFGRSVYSVWVNKYGKDKADQLLKEFRLKQSISGKGKRLGISPKHTCGKGWKGRYRDFYFRSLMELSYVIYLDEQNIPWKSAECKEFTINYVTEFGDAATYKPDFLINTNELIEIKPKALQNTKSNTLKREAAIKFCKNNGMTYKMMDFEIDTDKIKKCLDNDLIEFSKDFKNKFLEFYNKKLKT